MYFLTFIRQSADLDWRLIAKIIAILLMLWGVLLVSFVKVPFGSIGVVFRFGKKHRVIGPGRWFLMPFIDEIYVTSKDNVAVVDKKIEVKKVERKKSRQSVLADKLPIRLLFIVIIPEGWEGTVIRSGDRTRTYQPGLHFSMPFFEHLEFEYTGNIHSSHTQNQKVKRSLKVEVPTSFFLSTIPGRVILIGVHIILITALLVLFTMN